MGEGIFISAFSGSFTSALTLNRLVQVRNGTCTSGTVLQGYSFDNVGNRLSLTTSAGTTSYAYDHADQLTSVTPPGQGATGYTYDGNGNLAARGSDSFTWDAENRLTAATVGGQNETNTYNGDGLRQSRTVGGSTKTFVWDVAAKLPVILDDGSGQYLYGPQGLVAKITPSGTFYYLADSQGSVLAIVSSSGAVVQNYAYDMYGAVTSQSGSLGSEQQFAGQQTDPDGLQDLRARFYDPGTGRFLSRDSWSIDDKAVFHPYVYARNNPTTVTDPSGHFGCMDFASDPNDANCAGNYNGQGQETEYNQAPTQAQIDAANAAQASAGTSPATLILSSATRVLNDAEVATAQRLAALPQMSGKIFTISEHVGAEVVDELNQTYDFMGSKQASQYWNESQFLESIYDHLLKANNFLVIDLTDFTPEQISAVENYLNSDSLPRTTQQIIRIGF